MVTAAHVGPPQIVRGEVTVPFPEMCRELISHYPKASDGRLTATARKVSIMLGNLGVESLSLARELHDPTIAGNAQVEERNDAAYEDSFAMGVKVGQQVLEAEGLEPHEVDTVYISHTMSHRLPGIGVALCRALGMRADVTLMNVSTAACAGGGLGLAYAYDRLQGFPHETVLVLCSERLTTNIRKEPTKDPVEKVYGGLFSDAAGACIVTSAAQRPGLVIEHAGQHRLDNSEDRYFVRLGSEGYRFASDKKAPLVAREVMPELRKQLRKYGRGTPEWTLLHPGSHKILDSMAMGLELDPDPKGVTRPSRESLRTGNKGGVAVLDVLRLMYANPPQSGQQGAVMALGPGVIMPWALGTWN
ncbi:hypothetical protein AOB60_00595 [Streptomyces noursei]|uniref:Chalcone/stilbene synthase N-terminal domain-containing protein n=2 Tax=Streptomyces noursei TaxID=1971 RepID=A0A2N8PR24_STRNR|nr:hypothetical protein AOB60_00595 [Streptomyces noursei]